MIKINLFRGTFPGDSIAVPAPYTIWSAAFSVIIESLFEAETNLSPLSNSDLRHRREELRWPIWRHLLGLHSNGVLLLYVRQDDGTILAIERSASGKLSLGLTSGQVGVELNGRTITGRLLFRRDDLEAALKCHSIILDDMALTGLSPNSDNRAAAPIDDDREQARTKPQQRRVKARLPEIFPDGIPTRDELTDKELCSKVSTAFGKDVRISPDTILRATGRRK